MPGGLRRFLSGLIGGSRINQPVLSAGARTDTGLDEGQVPPSREADARQLADLLSRTGGDSALQDAALRVRGKQPGCWR